MAASDKLHYLLTILAEWHEYPLQVVKRLVFQIKADVRFGTIYEQLEALDLALLELKNRHPDSKYERFELGAELRELVMSWFMKE